LKEVGFLSILFGALLIAGEYLCVEVAWRCMDYNQFYTGFGMLLMGVGIISAMIGANNNDQTDMANMGKVVGPKRQ